MAAATVEVERKFRLTDAALARIRAQCRATGPPTELAVSGLDDPRLCPFAELRTTRETFTVPDVDADAEIGVDSAEFLEGDHKSVVDTFGLVEIEIMCTPGGAEEANARRRIESVAEHLFGKKEAKEMQADQKLQGGKLMFYLEKYNPKMYEALVQKYVEKMAKRKHEGGTHL
eukprot:g14749.t1